jgi:hypothetical protein
MIDNEKVFANLTAIEKADLAVSDLTGTAGALQPAQQKEFLRILINESVMMKQVYVKEMASRQELFEKTRFGSRVLRAGAEATALSSGDRVKPDLSKVTLTPSLFKAEVRLNNEVLEDQIERESFAQTVLEMLAERIGLDIDELIVNGDTASGDTFLASFDGMLKAATSNVVAGGTVALNKAHLRDMQKSMPSEFLRNKEKLRYFTSVDAEIDYRDSIMNRQTPLGDGTFVGRDGDVGYGKTPVIPVPVFPENQGAGTNETSVLLMDPKNWVTGVWRDITVETDKDVPAGVTIFVASLRLGGKYLHEPAVVKLTGVKVA